MHKPIGGILMANDQTNGSSDGVPDVTSPKWRLTKPHRLVQAALEADRAKPNPYTYRLPDPGLNLSIHVSKAQKRMALIVMDRLIKALAQQDIEVEVLDGPPQRGAYAVVGHDRTPVGLSELTKQVAHEPTAKELQDHEKYGSRIPKWDQAYTGELHLTPGGRVDLSSEQTLQKVIDKAVADVQAELAKAKAKREAEAEIRHREFERAETQRREDERVKALYAAADSFDRYCKLMDYIAEVRRFGRVPDNQRVEGQTLEEWLNWAEWRARHIHPIG